ncbi:S-layer homology domain-containing protein [Slackia piriformis]|nr:S-layer homology domain-containing protein [Slackia piriformis]
MAVTDEEAWNNATVTYNGQQDAYGNWFVYEGDTFSVEKIVTTGGEELSGLDGYSVLYFQRNSAALVEGNTLVDAEDAIDHRAGGMPSVEGDYAIVVVQGSLRTDVEYTDATTLKNIKDAYTGKGDTLVYRDQAFQVKKETKSLEGAYAFAGTDMGTDAAELAKTTFAYNGGDVKFAFAVGTDRLVQGTDFTVSWTKGTATYGSGQYTIAGGAAGTYTAHLVGMGAYAGSSADVNVVVAQLDLTSDAMTADAVDSKANYTVNAFTDENGTYLNRFKADGKALVAGADVAATFLDWTDAATNSTSATNPTKLDKAGVYRFQLAPKGDTENVVGSAVVEVSVYGEPGEYTITMVEKPGAAMATGGSATGTFTVVASKTSYKDAVLFLALDGKNYQSQTVEYTGQAFALTVVAKTAVDGGKVIDAANYEVALEKGGEAVEQILEPGDYDLTVTFGDGTEKLAVVKVGKAVIRSAEPTADFFATDGETAAVPSFVGSNDADFDRGVKFDLAADQISVKYYASKTNVGTDTILGTADDYLEADTAKEVKADELTEEGTFWAQINVLSTAELISGTLTATDNALVPFQVKETAHFADVAADAWYAESVYKAWENGYVDGVAAGVFAPEQAMTRAEFAKLVANMAGYYYGTDASYPTQFSDVPADAWFAGAVEWAARYGIVTGTSETTFGPYGTITREEIATMLYRYAGNGAQADASALDAFVDGAQVSDWAENAMAWAVENGYMNGKGANDLQPQATATRAEIAALAVRVQPEAL